jgi:hypothetical protein
MNNVPNLSKHDKGFFIGNKVEQIWSHENTHKDFTNQRRHSEEARDKLPSHVDCCKESKGCIEVGICDMNTLEGNGEKEFWLVFPIRQEKRASIQFLSDVRSALLRLHRHLRRQVDVKTE